MRNFLIVIILLASSLLVNAQNFDSVTIKTTKVAGSVYMLEGSGGNIGEIIGHCPGPCWCKSYVHPPDGGFSKSSGRGTSG